MQKSCDSLLFTLQLDELSDLSGRAQLLVFICIVANRDVVDNLLCCKILREATKGKDIFEIVDHYLKIFHLPWDKCIRVCTDGTLSVTGSVKGFISFAKEKN